MGLRLLPGCSTAFTDLLARGRRSGRCAGRRSSATSTTPRTPTTRFPRLPATPIASPRCRRPNCSSASRLDPLLSDASMLRSALPAKGTAFQTRLGQFQAIQNSGGTSFANSVFVDHGALHRRVRFAALRRFGDWRPSDHGSRRTFRASSPASLSAAQRPHRPRSMPNWRRRVRLHSPADQVTALTAAAKALLGDDFQIIPEFTVSAGARRRVGQCR